MPALNTRRAKAVALVGAGLTAGVIGAWTLSSNAQGSTPSSSGSAPSTSGTSTSTTAPSVPTGPMDHDGDHHGGPGGGPGRGPGGGPGGGPGAQNPDETLVTGTKESTLKAAALKQVPGGTVDRVETDSGDAAYEVHMTNASGKQVTVKFDKFLKFVAVEDGMGK